MPLPTNPIQPILLNIPYQYIPSQIKPTYLQPNLKLLNDETIQHVKEVLSDQPFNRYGKLKLKTNYGIYYGKEGLFAIFNENGKQFQLGDGNYGYVKLAQNLDTGEWRALKIQKLSKEDSKKNFIHECHVLYELGKSFDPEGIIRTGKDVDKGNVMMDLASGSEIFEFLYRRFDPKTPAQEANDFAADAWPDSIWLDMGCKILESIKTTVHDKNLFHMDIKIENLIWDIARRTIIPIDFGLANEYKLDQEGNKYFKGLLKGTPTYMAPELWTQSWRDGFCLYTEKTEIFALGIVLKHILLNHSIKLNNITRKHEEIPLSKIKTLFEQDKELHVIELLDKMTNTNPDRRPTLIEAIKTLNEIRENFIQKYPENYTKASLIYTKAATAETDRLKKIYGGIQQSSDRKENKENTTTSKEKSNLSKFNLFSTPIETPVPSTSEPKTKTESEDSSNMQKTLKKI